MNNQILLWSMLIVPWFTLFFMKMHDIRRFMPAGLLSAVTSVLISEIIITLKLEEIRETAYPLINPPFLFGLNPVLTMWMLKFFYKKFIAYCIVEVVLNLGFAFLFLGMFLPSRGILYILRASPLLPFAITTAHSLMLYAYQIWQEKIFKTPYREGPEKH